FCHLQYRGVLFERVGHFHLNWFGECLPCWVPLFVESTTGGGAIDREHVDAATVCLRKRLMIHLVLDGFLHSTDLRASEDVWAAPVNEYFKHPIPNVEACDQIVEVSNFSIN